MQMLKHLDRYILVRFLKAFFFVILLLGFLICVIDFADKNDDFLEHNLSYWHVLRYYSTFLTYIMSYVTPITVFITTVFLTSRMSTHTEIVAILCSGVSFLRFLFPYFIGSTLIALLSFYLYGWIVPESNKFRVAFEQAYIKNPFFFTQQNVHFKVGEELYLYFRNYDNHQQRAYEVILEQMEGSELQARLYADHMTWDTLENSWQLKNWRLRDLLDSGEQLSIGRQQDTTLQLSPEDFESMHGLKETLTMRELDAHIALLRERGDPSVSIYEVEKYGRYMQPFAVLLLTFMGVLVSARKSREGMGFLIVLGFMIAFVYVIFFVLAKSMAEVGSLPPQIAVWLPNLAFGAISLILYHTLPR